MNENEAAWQTGSKFVEWNGVTVLETKQEMTLEDARELVRILNKYRAQPSKS